jgi:hypothetical protein
MTNPSAATKEPALGQSKSNAYVSAAAEKLFAHYRRVHTLDPVVSYCEIEGDRCSEYFQQLCIWLSKHNIPSGGSNAYDENLQAKDPTKKRVLTLPTLELYVGQHFKVVRTMFPNHRDWKHLSRDEFPRWYTTMKQNFRKEVLRNQITTGDDVTFGLDDCQPLYKDNGTPVVPDVDINEFVSYIDLKKILLRLMTSRAGAKPFQQRCVLILAGECIARGGEVRYQNYNDWQYHPSIDVTNIGWSELKTIESYAMPMVCDKIHWVFDFYHSLACYFMLERGLFRSEDEIKEGRLNVVFPSLLNVNDRSTTTQVTKIIQANLPTSCPLELKKTYTATSIRKGVITALACDGRLTIFDVCARTGHSTGTSVDHYIDKNNVAYSLRAAKARAGYLNLNAPSAVPKLDSLGLAVNDQIKQLMDKVFIVNVPGFEPGGRLYPILQICMASLIMYHPIVIQDIGPVNHVTRRLSQAAKEVGLCDPRLPNYPPEGVLLKWGKIIEDDYKSRSSEHSQVEPDNLISIAATLNHTLKTVSTIVQTLQHMGQQYERLNRNIETQGASLAALHMDINDIRNKLRVFKSPAPVDVPRATIRHASQYNVKRTLHYSFDDGTTTSEQDDNEVAAFVKRPVEDDRTCERKPPAKKQFFGSTIYDSTTSEQDDSEFADFANHPEKVDTTSEQKPSGKKQYFGDTFQVPSIVEKGVELKDWLTQLRCRTFVNVNDISLTPIPQDFCKEKSLMQYCLELCQRVSTPEERKVLSDKDSSDLLLQNTVEKIQKKCMKEMCVLEGIDPGLEGKNNKSRKEPTYVGLGRRVQKHKKRLIDRRGLEGQLKTVDQPLVQLGEVDDAKATGTPPGHRSVASYFPKFKIM